MRQRDRDRFVKKANALIDSLGAIRIDGTAYLETKAGRLTIRVDDAKYQTNGLGTVFTHFHEPKRALDVVWGAHENPVHSSVNPHSGKWNFHYFSEWTVIDALEDLEYQLRKVM